MSEWYELGTNQTTVHKHICMLSFCHFCIGFCGTPCCSRDNCTSRSMHLMQITDPSPGYPSLKLKKRDGPLLLKAFSQETIPFFYIFTTHLGLSRCLIEDVPNHPYFLVETCPFRQLCRTIFSCKLKHSGSLRQIVPILYIQFLLNVAPSAIKFRKLIPSDLLLASPFSSECTSIDPIN